MGKKTEEIFERAKINLEENNHENALRLFNEVLNREPSHRQALRNKGLIKMMSKEAAEAEEFLLFAIRQCPDDHQLYQMLGSFYHNNDSPAKALAQFKKSIELNKNDFLAHKGLGMLYAHFYNEHEKAVTHFSHAIKGDNTSAELYFSRGCSQMILKNMSDAESDFKKAGELGSTKAKEMLQKYFN